MTGFALGAVTTPSLVPQGGIKDMADFEAFVKAVQASSYTTDHTALTGSSALRRESLEGQLRKVVETEDSFPLFKNLACTPVTSIVHE